SRNPQLFRSTDLEKYVLEIDPKKKNLLLMNKADMLTKNQRREWGLFLQKNGVRYLFFSAKKENEKLEKENEAAKLTEAESDKEIEAVEKNEPRSHYQSEPKAEESYDDGNDDLLNRKVGMTYHFEEDGVVEDQDNFPEDESEISNSNESDEYVTEESESEEEEDISKRVDFLEIQEDEKEENIKEDEEDDDDDEISRVISVDELIRILQIECPEPSSDIDGGKSTIGFVGYPNVGKSSTLNAIVGSKKVAVASTPGKTKHFQTIHLDGSTILCDCPGLVFPSFATTKADMVCNGILPIDQLREHTGPVALLAERIPRKLLEVLYGIRIVMKNVEGLEVDDSVRKPTSEEILQSYAIARGYTKSGQGNPDEARAARYILKDYVNGKLVFVHSPPNIEASKFNQDAHNHQISQLHQKKQQFLLTKSEATVGAPFTSKIDTEFFLLNNSTKLVHARTKGKFASSDFARNGTKEGGGFGTTSLTDQSNKKKHHNKGGKRQGKIRTKWTAVE
ncbi:hypothetical protein HK096_008128, partial [Nowakowskiella sp. JEL0078]